MDVLFYLAVLLWQVADWRVWLVVALAGLMMALLAWRRLRQRRAARGVSAGFVLAGVFFLFCAGYQFWYTHRPLPAENTRDLFPGITYSREVRTDPRPLVMHVVRVDLGTPGLRFHITPPDTTDDLPLKARTTSQFLAEHDLQLAVNAGFFTPWWSQGIFNYYPKAGDAVTVKGLYAAEGAAYGIDRDVYPTLYLSPEQRASFTLPASVYNALSGDVIFVTDGEVTLNNSPYHTRQHPRTAIGFDAGFETMLLFLVDGRQPNYSEGVNMYELADIALELGAWYALNLDGGGSTALVIEGADGTPALLNSPIDHGLPGRERAVASHFGISVEAGTP